MIDIKFFKMTNQELIEKAASVIRHHKDGQTSYGDVGCALLSDSGKIYQGVCIDMRSSMGFCAEHSAIAAMIASGEEPHVKKIVAVWKNDQGDNYILSPCGRCREFMYQIDKRNRETEVVLEKDRIVKLKELLPYSDWYREVRF